jgi:late competence protein required for DNA uptake (superfamily II DNA/RNA helicase)
MTLVCVNGVSQWNGSMSAVLQEIDNAVLPGTAADNSVTLAVTPSGITEAVSSPITVALQALWASAVGSPSITGIWTTFRKVA